MRKLAPELPLLVLEAVTAFQTEMRSIERSLVKEELHRELAQQRVSAACDTLFHRLQHEAERTPGLEQTIGTYAFQETSAFFMLSQMAKRSYLKPHGYAGDFYTIDLVYQDNSSGQGLLGPLIDRWFLDIHAARAVKNRRGLLVTSIRAVAEERAAATPVRVTSLASGPAREVLDVLAQPVQPTVHFTCIDIDPEAISYATALAEAQGASSHVTFARDNVLRLAHGRGKTVLVPQHLIYSIGLFDYLSERLIVRILDWIHDSLLPGGITIVGNFDKSNPDKFFMDHILDWKLHHRSTQDLRALFARSKFGDRPVEIRHEETGINLFAFCRKS